MSQSVASDGPTPERLAKYGANFVVAGSGRHAVPQARYRNLYEMIADPEIDALSEDYGESMSRIIAAEYAFRLSARANAGRASDTSGEGSSDGMPLTDFYLAVKRRFAEHRNHMATNGKVVDHWSTIELLMQSLPDNADEAWIKANVSAMFRILPQVEAALELLAQASLAISKAYREGVDTRREGIL